MKRRDFLAAAPALVSFASMRLFGTTVARADTWRLNIGVPVDSTIYLPAMLGVSLGYFKDEGADVQVMSMGGGSNVRQAIAAQQLPYAIGDVAHPLAMTGGGRKSKVLLATDTRATVANILVRSDLWDSGIKSLADLGSIKRPDGLKPQVAVTRIGSATWIYGKFILSKLGLANVVEFVSIPDGAPMLGALRTKRIDALVSNNITYFAVMDDNLGKPVFDTSDKAAWDKFFGSSIASQCLFALESQVVKNPQQTQAIVNGVYRGLKYIEKNPPEQLYEVIKGFFLQNLEPSAVIREIAYMRPLFDLDGVISKEAYQNGSPIWFNEETKISPQPYAEMVDFSFLETAKKKYG